MGRSEKNDNFHTSWRRRRGRDKSLVAPIIYRCVLVTFSAVGILSLQCGKSARYLAIFGFSVCFFFSQPKNRVVGPPLAPQMKLPLWSHPWNKALLSSETEAANLWCEWNQRLRPWNSSQTQAVNSAVIEISISIAPTCSNISHFHGLFTSKVLRFFAETLQDYEEQPDPCANFRSPQTHRMPPNWKSNFRQELEGTSEWEAQRSCKSCQEDQ